MIFAVEGKDYRIANSTLRLSTGGSDCVTVFIIDDNTVEPDETFEVQFTELDWELAPECGMIGSGGGSGEPDTSRMLSPMITNATVLVTIRDNDVAKEGEILC